MARPDSTRRRVSHLVGRFEQLASKPKRTSAEVDDDDKRPRSHHGEVNSCCRTDSPFGRRAFSVVSESTLETKLAEERYRIREMMDECESLRKRCRDDEESRQLLKQKLEQSDLARQGYEAQHKHMERKLECLRQQLSTRDETGMVEQERADAEIDELRQQLCLSENTRQTAREDAKVEVQRQHDMLAVKLRDSESKAEAALRKAQNLERQLLDLKQNMSTSTKIENQVTDQEIVEKMSRFNHELQNWVVNVFRKVKLGDADDIRRRFESSSILTRSSMLRSLYSDFESTSKLFALQSTVIYLLMEIFEGDHFFGLPEELGCLKEAAHAIRSTTAAYNEWRSQTFLLLQRAEGGLKKKIDSATEERKGQILRGISEVLSALTDIKLNESQMGSLSRIVENANTLSRLFSSQLAVYRCMLPENDADHLEFDEIHMEDVFDAEATSHRTIRCVTSPVVLKIGDEKGDNMSLKNVVVKAKVLCHAEDDSSDDD